MTGVGFSLIYIPATVSVATYFDKNRAFASGIASTGCGFGAFIFAPIINLLDNHFGWSWTLMAIGSVVLFCIPAGLLMPFNINKSKPSTENGDATAESFDEETNCFGCITNILATKMGKIYTDLLQDARFLLYLMSIVLTNIGLTAPFAYTMVSKQYRIPMPASAHFPLAFSKMDMPQGFLSNMSNISIFRTGQLFLELKSLKQALYSQSLE